MDAAAAIAAPAAMMLCVVWKLESWATNLSANAAAAQTVYMISTIIGQSVIQSILAAAAAIVKYCSSYNKDRHKTWPCAAKMT